MNLEEKGEGVRKGSLYMLFALSFVGVSLFLFQIISARKIGKSDFGKLGVFYSLFSFLADFLASGFRDFIAVSIPGIFEEEKLKEFIGKVFFSFLFYSLLFYLLLWIFSPFFLAKFFDQNILSFFLFSLCFIFLFSVMFIRGILFGFRRISYVAISQLTFGILILITGISLYFFKNSKIFHFELSYVISLFFPLPVTFYLVKRVSPIYLNFKNLINLKTPIYMSTINAILETYFYIGILLMKVKNTPYEQIGIFNAMLTFFMGVKTFYSAIFMPLLPNLSYVLAKKDRRLFKHYTKRVISLIIITFLIMFGLSITFLPSLWNFLFGKGFKFYKIDFILLSIIISIYLMLRLLSRIYFALKEISYIFYSFLAFLFLLPALFFLLPLSSLLAIEISFLITSSILLFILSFKIFIRPFKSANI